MFLARVQLTFRVPPRAAEQQNKSPPTAAAASPSLQTFTRSPSKLQLPSGGAAVAPPTDAHRNDDITADGPGRGSSGTGGIAAQSAVLNMIEGRPCCLQRRP